MKMKLFSQIVSSLMRAEAVLFPQLSPRRISFLEPELATFVMISHSGQIGCNLDQSVMSYELSIMNFVVVCPINTHLEAIEPTQAYIL